MDRWTIAIFACLLVFSFNTAKSKPLSEEPHRVLYQVYIETFKDGALDDGAGDFAGLKEKLSYLNDLGVSGLLLMPVFRVGAWVT
jgi:alpha-amylase